MAGAKRAQKKKATSPGPGNNILSIPEAVIEPAQDAPVTNRVEREDQDDAAASSLRQSETVSGDAVPDITPAKQGEAEEDPASPKTGDTVASKTMEPTDVDAAATETDMVAPVHDAANVPDDPSPQAVVHDAPPADEDDWCHVPKHVDDEDDMDEVEEDGVAAADPSEVFLLVLGDQHFTATRTAETAALVTESLALLDRLCETMGECLGGVVLAGDMLDRFHMRPLKDATSWVWELQKRRPVWILVGNHDRPDHTHFQTDMHPFHALACFPAVTVVASTMVAEIKGFKFLFAPYVPDGRFDEALKTAFPGGTDLEANLQDIYAVFAHQTFYGAEMNGLTSSSGDRWPVDRPIVLSGHIHEFARLQPNIWYVGSAYQITFSESTDKASFLARFRKDAKKDMLSPHQIDLTLPVHGAPARAGHPYASCFQYQRISLNIPCKETVRVPLAEVENYKWVAKPEVSQTRVIVEGTIEIMNAARRSAGFNSALRALLRNPKIVFKWQVTNAQKDKPTVTTDSNAAVPFLQRLSDAANNQNFKRAFERAFGVDGKDAIKRLHRESVEEDLDADEGDM